VRRYVADFVPLWCSVLQAAQFLEIDSLAESSAVCLFWFDSPMGNTFGIVGDLTSAEPEFVAAPVLWAFEDEP
jgi:hypothetical protein